jgi:hypothetical protein
MSLPVLPGRQVDTKDRNSQEFQTSSQQALDQSNPKLNDQQQLEKEPSVPYTLVSNNDHKDAEV